MITAHHKDSLTLFDGTREHRIEYAAFVEAKAHGKGGLHPAYTEEWQTLLPVGSSVDLSKIGMETKEYRFKDVAGIERVVTCAPLCRWLFVEYGPDKQIASVPIDSDAAAQRLHWLHRNEKERAEMKALLQYLGVWRLTESGEVPNGE